MHVITEITPRWGAHELQAFGWKTFQGRLNSSVLYPPFEGGGVFAFFAKMAEDDQNSQIS